MNKYEQFQLILAEVTQIEDLHSYHTIFLATMLLRKIRHPEEGLREVTKKTMKTMEKRYSYKKTKDEEEDKMRKVSMEALNKRPNEYGKTNVISVSLERCLDNLEMALETSKLPKEIEERMTGNTVKFVFDYFTAKIEQKMQNFAEE